MIILRNSSTGACHFFDGPVYFTIGSGTLLTQLQSQGAVLADVAGSVITTQISRSNGMCGIT